MVGERYIWVVLKWPKNEKIMRPKVAAAAAFAGPIRVRPAGVGREISQPISSDGGAPPCPARVQCWWPESAPTAETRSVTPRNIP